MTRSVLMAYAFVAMYGLAYGGFSPNSVRLTSEFFGVKTITTILGFVTLASGIGATLGTWLAEREKG